METVNEKFRIISFLIIFAVGAMAVILIYLNLKELTVPEDPFVTLTQPSNEVKGSQLLSEVDAEQEITLLAIGDIMLGRYVENLMNSNTDNYPFEKIADLLDSVDLTVGNLEGPIVANHSQTPNGSLSFSFQPKTAQTLTENNIDIVTLSNNHTLDRGVSGYLETISYLDNAAVEHFGHSSQINESSHLHKEEFGLEIDFLGFNATSSGFDNQAALKMITDLKNDDSFIIISIHWGSEYQLSSNQTQKGLAHSFIDAGADLILGHHPHVVQEIELYNDKLIFYSLGNFIFDQYFSENTQQGLAVKITLNKETANYQLLPLQSEKSQPYVMTDDKRNQILTNLESRSNIALQTNQEIILHK